MALLGIGYGCRGGTEQRLQLVGPQRFHRREAGQKQGRNGDQAAASGNGIDETGGKAGKDQKYGNIVEEGGHGGRLFENAPDHRGNFGFGESICARSQSMCANSAVVCCLRT